MVYVRKAYDKLVTQSISTRSRDPNTPLDVQRNIDESFRAINGLRVLTGADPVAIARALNYNRALNQVSARFSLSAGDQTPPGTDDGPEIGIIQGTDENNYVDYPNATYHNNQFHWTRAAGSIYVWSIKKVVWWMETDPPGMAYPVSYIMRLLEPGKNPNSGVAGTAIMRNVANFNAMDQTPYTIPAASIYGQEEGQRRTFKERTSAFLAVNFGAPTPDVLRIWARITILYDRKGAV
jgi:hypothetical protein